MPSPTLLLHPDSVLKTTGDGCFCTYDDEGRLHGEPGYPAKVSADGFERFYYTHGLLDREIGPAYENLRTGEVKHCRLGELHNDLGPAVSVPGEQPQWWFEGERIDHPDGSIAVLLPSGLLEFQGDHWMLTQAGTGRQIAFMTIRHALDVAPLVAAA